MIYKNLTAFAKDVQKCNQTAAFRALNKTMSKANTAFKKAVGTSTGIKKKDLAKRFRVKKASQKSLSAYVSMGTRYSIPTSYFKPKAKIIRGKGKTKRKGVTIKIGEADRTVVPNAWMWETKSGKNLVLIRKSRERKPTAQPKVNLFQYAKQHQDSLKRYAASEYKTQFSAQLKYELSKR